MEQPTRIHVPPPGATVGRPPIRRRASARPLRPALAPSSLWRLLDVRFVAVVLGVLAGLGLLGATLSFTVDLFVAPWRIFTLDVEESVHLVASVVGLAGAFQLYRTGRGRPLVLTSLGLNVLATLVFSASTLLTSDTLVPMLTWLGLAALTVFSRPVPGGAGRPADRTWP